LLDPNNPEHRSTHASVRRGDIDACSFAFRCVSDTWQDATDRSGNRYALRLLNDVDLQDCSVVCYPAYQQTTVQARALLLFPDGQPAEVRSALQTYQMNKTFRVSDAEFKQRRERMRRQQKLVL